jgi:hypothetical protein
MSGFPKEKHAWKALLSHVFPGKAQDVSDLSIA